MFWNLQALKFQATPGDIPDGFSDPKRMSRLRDPQGTLVSRAATSSVHYSYHFNRATPHLMVFASELSLVTGTSFATRQDRIWCVNSPIFLLHKEQP